MMKNYLSHILPFFFALDLIIPFLLAPTYKGYSHLTQVMSVLGNSKAPLHLIYNIWLIVFGVAIVFFALFIMADKPYYRGTVIAFEGLWQRLSLLFMYCPIAILSLNITIKS